jgi:DNA-3-methyladenine glycosylase I
VGAVRGRPRARCGWAEGSDALRDYHDLEWGVPSHDDRHLFEMLSLEGAQAGLSWSTILAKRDGYRRAFAEFDAGRVARFTPARVDRLVADPSIVRHRGKIESVVGNARCVLELSEAFGSFAAYVWSFTDGRPVVNRWRRMDELPAETPLSRTLSRDLRGRGFRFVGPTTCYSFLQAVGVVDDHLAGCFRRSARARS